MEQIERIAHMENLLNQAAQTVAALLNALEAYEDAKDALRELEAYYTGPLWFADYEADREGRLPETLLRGVLSEDAVYSLLADRDEALRKMHGLCKQALPTPGNAEEEGDAHAEHR